MLLLAYHCNVASKPWENDLLANDDSQDRLDYNGFTYVPFARLNGSGSSASSITSSKINQEFQKKKYFTFDVIGEITGNSPHACDIKVKITAADDYSANSQLKLFTAIVEDDIDYYEVYGTHAKNGLDDYSHVLRKLLPTSSGESLGTSISSGETKEFTYSYTNDDAKQNYKNIRVIVFVQNSGTREIIGVFQTADHPFQMITEIATPFVVQIPNKLTITKFDNGEIGFTLPLSGNVTVALHSLNGKLLYNKQHIGLLRGSHKVKLGNHSIKNRCYIVTLTSGATQVSKRVIPVK